MAAHDTRVDSRAASLGEAGRHDLRVAYATTSEDVEALVERERPDVVLVDWKLPDTALCEFARCLRLQKEPGTLPIVMLTIRGRQTQRICVLSTEVADGAFKSSEWPDLMTRIQLILRSHANDQLGGRMHVGEIEIDYAGHRVWRRGREVHLAPTEFRLLHCLMQRPYRVVSRSQILSEVWQGGAQIGARTIDVHISRLRRALICGKQYNPIRTVRGSGYCFEAK